jgi:hypothetical protein
MNTLWLSNLEILYKERRADFRREMEQLNLIREAENAYGARQSWLERNLHRLGSWMMLAGERLRNRYHAPTPLPRWYQSRSLAR